MADNVQWLKIKVGMFDGNSFKKIKRAKIGGVSYKDKLTAVWFELLDLAGKSNANGCLIDNNEIPYHSFEDISIMLDRDENEIELCMQFFINEKMVEIIDDIYCLTNFVKYQNEDGLERIREQKRIAQAKWRERKKQGLINFVDKNQSTVDSTDNLLSISYSISNSNSNNIYDELLELLNKKFNTNKKGFREETKDIINKELENGVSLDELKRRLQKAPLENFNLNDALLSDDEKVFNFWNNQKIIKHTKLTPQIKKAIEKALKTYSLEEITTYIERYNKVINDDSYFFNYKWTLTDFLNRKDGISSFTDEGSKWISYTTKKVDPKNTKIISHNYTSHELSSVYDNLDDIII